MENKSFGTDEIAGMCSVTRPTVSSWIDKSVLPSYTTPGGHRRVWVRDLIAFLKAYNIPVPKELLSLGKIKILIVDDESEVRRVVRRIILKHYPTVEVHEASNGFEAGTKVIDLIPSLVILDIKLPGASGTEVCRTIRQNKNLSGVKILAITGFNIKENRKQILSEGADDFLAKPFVFKALVQKIEKLVPDIRNKHTNFQEISAHSQK